MQPRIRIQALTLGVAAILLISQHIQAETWVVTDRAEWESIVGGSFSEETFSSATFNPELSAASDDGAIGGGRWQDQLRVSGGQTQETTFHFAQPVKAIGADWFMAIGGSGAYFLLDGSQVVRPRVPDSFNGSFYGFVSDSSFSSVTMVSRLPGQGNGIETFTMDNLVYSSNFNGTIVQPAAVTMQTNAHPIATTLSVDFYLNNPDFGGQLLTSTGPLHIDGSIDVATQLDAAGNGYVELRSADLHLQNFGPTSISLGALGTVDASLNNIHILLESMRMNVSNYQFEASTNNPVILELNGGSAALTNPQGIIASLLPAGFQLNFAVDPVVTSADGGIAKLLGSVDLDSHGFVDGAEVNLAAPTFMVHLGHVVSNLDVYARISTDIHVAVPEASSVMLSASAVAVGACLHWGKRRRDGAARSRFRLLLPSPSKG